jgi:hypothetical protein
MQRFPSYFCNVLRVILSCSFCFQRRYANRPIVELEGAAQEELKITELRLAKLFSAETAAATTSAEGHISQQDKAAGIDQFYLLTQCVVKNLLFFSTYMCLLVIYHVVQINCRHILVFSCNGSLIGLPSLENIFMASKIE